MRRSAHLLGLVVGLSLCGGSADAASIEPGLDAPALREQLDRQLDRNEVGRAVHRWRAGRTAPP